MWNRTFRAIARRTDVIRRQWVKISTRSLSAGLSMDDINQHLVRMKYAVRGEIPTAAEKIRAEIEKASKNGAPNPFPFDEVLFCNIGNPQALGQKPISFYRSVLAILDYPSLLQCQGGNKFDEIFGNEAVERAKEMLGYLGVSGTGAYSDSRGVAAVRRNVAKFIEKRDQYQQDPENILLSDGASSAIRMLLTALIAGPKDSVLVPIPQYPLYSALIELFGGQLVGYFLDEEKQWALSEEELERRYEESLKRGETPRAMVVVNPGNPTGNILSYDDMVSVAKFCHRRNLVLLADEVYQDNVYDSNKPFYSFHRVISDLKLPVILASFHSTSKGFIGECGRRGGYMATSNFPSSVFDQIVKLASSGLCSNLNGQVMVDLMVRPPVEGMDKTRFDVERDLILKDLKKKADTIYARFNEIPGIHCQPVEGAMYAFPKLEFSSKFVEKARRQSKNPDELYALSLLEATGICCVPGSGFKQYPGTSHIRTTILPKFEKLEWAMKRFKEFHETV